MFDYTGISEQIISLGAIVWPPLLIWTILTVLVLAVFRYADQLHVHIHYHLRLGLLLALPAGLLLAGLFEFTGWLQTQTEDAISGYKLLVIRG